MPTCLNFFPNYTQHDYNRDNTSKNSKLIFRNDIYSNTTELHFEAVLLLE